MGGAPQRLALGLNGFFAVVVTALVAYMVRALQFTAIGAFTVTRARQSVM